MPDPFDEARREIDRVRRQFEKHFDHARSAIERAAEQFRARLPDIAAIVEARLAEARLRPDGGRKPPRGGLVRRRRPRNPGPGPSPMPAPVRPLSPSHLSGGAEAPLDP